MTALRRTALGVVLVLAGALTAFAAEPLPGSPPDEAPSAAPSAASDRSPQAPTAEPCVYGSPIPGPARLPEGWSQETQDLLMAWSTPVIEALGLGEDGFTLAYAPPTVTVLSPDPLPPSLDAVVSDAAAAGVTITWEETSLPYDPERLMEQSAALITALPDTVDVAGVGPTTGATGLRVLVTAELDDTGCAEVRRVAEQVAPGVPLVFAMTEEGSRLMIDVHELTVS